MRFVPAAGLALLLGCGRIAPDQWVASARDAHRAADAALAGGDPGAARRVLQASLETPAPAGVAGEDRRAIVQDTAFRLAAR